MLTNKGWSFTQFVFQRLIRMQKLHVLCISKYLLDVVLLMNLDTITTHFYFLSILTSVSTETDRVC